MRLLSRSVFAMRPLIALALVAVTIGSVGLWWRFHVAEAADAQSQPPSEQPRMVDGTLVIPLATARSMRLRAAPVRPIVRPTKLRLTGQLMLDPNRLVHVTSRFGGEVVSIAEQSPSSPIAVGQRVEQGQLLAILWSKEMGEKKSDLADALSQLYVDRTIFQRLKDLSSPGVVTQRTVDEMQRKYESDVIQVERLRRTLISWRITSEEIAKIEAEAQRIHQQALQGPESVAPPDAMSGEPGWANIEVRSPISGTVMERNLTIGDIVGADHDLFKVADLSQLVVMAYIYEDDLPSLLALAPDQRTWQIHVDSRFDLQPLTGAIDVIGNVIDPSQHTAVIQGRIDNSAGALRVGQFIEATMDLPPRDHGWEVPLAAIIDSGDQAYVLIAQRDDLTCWKPLLVAVRRRTQHFAWIASDEHGLREGDRLLTVGGDELLGVIQEQSPTAEPVAPAGAPVPAAQ